MNNIKQALKDKGHELLNIWNVKQRVTKKPLPIHFVDIKPSGNNKEVYNIHTLLKHLTPNEKSPNACAASNSGTQKTTAEKTQDA